MASTSTINIDEPRQHALTTSRFRWTGKMAETGVIVFAFAIKIVFISGETSEVSETSEVYNIPSPIPSPKKPYP
jgi:hypothetical protein